MSRLHSKGSLTHLLPPVAYFILRQGNSCVSWSPARFSPLQSGHEDALAGHEMTWIVRGYRVVCNGEPNASLIYAYTELPGMHIKPQRVGVLSPIAVRQMSSSTMNTIDALFPAPTLPPSVLSPQRFPGASTDSLAALQYVLKDNHKRWHIFYNDLKFHKYVCSMDRGIH